MQYKIEDVKDYWINKDLFLNYSEKRLYRCQGLHGKGRMYYDESFKQFVSATTFGSMVQPKDKRFLEWYRAHPNPELYVEQKAAYGTLFHIFCSLFLKTGELSDAFIEQEIDNVCRQFGWNLQNAWYEGNGDYCGLRKAARSFAQFMVDYEVQPLATEIGLSHPDGIATFIDLVCYMTIQEKGFFGEVYKSGEQKGNPKETKRAKKILGLINLKSGKNFYPEHIQQLMVEKMIWEHNYPDLKIDAVYNLSPVDYDTVPTYKLKEQDLNDEEMKINLLKIPAICAKLSRKVLYLDGTEGITAGKEPGKFEGVNYLDWLKKEHTAKFGEQKSL